MEKTSISNPKKINKVKVMQDILVSKYGLNSAFCNYSSFIHLLFSKYLCLGNESNIYFEAGKIICSSNVIGDSPYTITITPEGNLTVSYFSELISNNKEWPQCIKVETQILYLAQEDGFTEITKKSHLYKGMSRSESSQNGQMINKLDYINFVIREFKNNIETYKCVATIPENEDNDIDTYHQISINKEDITGLISLIELIPSISSLEDIKNALASYSSISLIKRDEIFKEKATCYQISDDNGYTKSSYLLNLENLNELIISIGNNIWNGCLPKERIEEILINQLNKISSNLTIPYDNDLLDMFLSLIKCFLGRINYPKIKSELENKISTARIENDEESTYDIEEGQVVKLSKENTKLF